MIKLNVEETLIVITLGFFYLGFRRIDFITKVTVDNKGVLEVKDRTVRIIYKVDWNINPGT